jgi:hypothetical protein
MDNDLATRKFAINSQAFTMSILCFFILNGIVLSIIAFADLDTGAKQLAVATFSVLGSIGTLLSLDNSVGTFKALTADLSDKTSNFTKNSEKSPWKLYQGFCVIITALAAATHLYAIYS